MTHSNLGEFSSHKLYLISPSYNEGEFFSTIDAILSYQPAILQYREKHLVDFDEKKRIALELKNICQKHQSFFIVNDDVQLALAVDAKGVHLGKSDMDICTARKILGPSTVIGATCHDDVKYAEACILNGANYCAFGSFFPSSTKDVAKILTPAARSLMQAFAYPWVAIGGITMKNVQEILPLSPDWVAVCSEVFSSEHPPLIAAQLHKILRENI